MSATAEALPVEVPDIGDFTDVPVIEILVSPGDAVSVDDPLLTLESDKATMDVPAPFAGVVKEVHVSIGDKVSQGSLLLTLETSEGAERSTDQAAAAASEGAPSEASAPEALESATEAEEDAAPTPEQAEADSDGASPVYASPAVRRLARERGIDLSAVSGSGRKGRITKQDVEQFSGVGGRSAA